MEHEALTSRILEACFEASNELGAGFLESVYEKALLVLLREKGLGVESQVPLKVRFHNEVVGEFFADLLVEQSVLLELKACNKLQQEHHAQIINYLNATEIDVGLLINFGKPKLEYKRFHRRK